MNKEQREDLAKYFWNISQITYGLLVIGLFAKRDEFDLVNFLGGIVMTVSFALLAFRLKRSRKRR